MGDADKLELAMSLCGAGDADSALVSAYLKVARSAILERRNPFASGGLDELWEPRFDTLQCEMAAEMFARRGAEGETAHSENGISRTYGSASVSRHLLQRVTPRGKVVGL